MNFLKKISIMFMVSLALSFIPVQVLPFFQPSVTVEGASARISKKSKIMYVSDKYTLKVTGTKQHVMWRSSDKKVAAVSSGGVVTAKKEGVATITATVGAGSSGKRLKCKITVKSRISAKKNYVRCYPDEYAKINITARGLKAKETLAIETKSNNVAKISSSKKSKYWSVIVEPKKIGYTQFTARIYKVDGWDVVPQKDAITIKVFNYPDKSGWISEYQLEAFGIEVLNMGDGYYEVFSDNGSSSLSGIVQDGLELDILEDEMINENTYRHAGIRYQIRNNTLYMKTEDMEKKFF